MDDGKKTHTLPEAARLAGVSEDELRCAIKDGLLQASFLQNTGEYHLSNAELDLYLRRSRNTPLNTGLRKRRVLIIDDEINFANIMKLELERDPRIEAKFATWGRDGVMMAESYKPDLCLIDFMLPDITGDDVLAAIQTQRDRRMKMVVYSAHTRDAIKQHPNLEARLLELGADEFLSKGAGMRALIAKVFELLGLENTTRIMRRV
ncbi:MAG: response regulator [Planctomycetes bacterium]|nr:response regulator [Planctomycetota bacterium]